MNLTELRELAIAASKREKVEVYAAWRSEYDYLYVVTHWPPGELMGRVAYIPSNNPDLKFQEFESVRYDVREENLSAEEWQEIRESHP